MKALILEFCPFLEGKAIIVMKLWELLDKSVFFVNISSRHNADNGGSADDFSSQPRSVLSHFLSAQINVMGPAAGQ